MMRGRGSVEQALLVVTLMLPVGAHRVTECGTYKQPARVRQPLEMNKIGEGVLEARFQLSSIPDNVKWASVLDLMNQDDTQTLSQLWIRHNSCHEEIIQLKCSISSSDDHSTTTTLPKPDTSTNLTLQDFFQLRVGCTHLYFDIVDARNFPLSFSRFKWASEEPHLILQKRECWMELSANYDGQNLLLLDHKCPFNLPKFPRLELGVRCVEDIEQCATINFCNNECEAAAAWTPVPCQEVTVPTPIGTREPIQHHTTCRDQMEVLELELVFTPPAGSEKSSVVVEVGTPDNNNTPVGRIEFSRYIIETDAAVVSEAIWLWCLRDMGGRVRNPWNFDTSLHTLSVSMQVAAYRMEIYQILPGTLHLVADQVCPLGVRGFPHRKLIVRCGTDEDCGEVAALPTIPEFTKIPSPRSPLEIDVSGGEETNLTFTLPNKSWSIKLYHYGVSVAARTELSYTPDNPLGHYWLEVLCDGDPPDTTSITLPPTPSTSPPPRFYLVQVGIDWMNVMETTPGHSQTTHQYNCSRPLPHFPNLTITVACSYGRVCGRVSQPCHTEQEPDAILKAEAICNTWRVEDLSVMRTVMQVALVMCVVAGVVSEALVVMWMQYVDINPLF